MTKILGILNVTPDSFSDGGDYFDPKTAAKQIKKLFDDGADIVDIGAVSTRYGATIIDHNEEWERLNPVLNLIDEQYKARISIDTFDPETANKAINLGIGMINDVSCGSNHLMLKAIASNPHVKYIMMYSLKLPANRDVRAKNMEEILISGRRTIDNALSHGISEKQLIFDPGIGFSTNSELSFNVIRDIEYYRQLSLPLCVGHSRKSFLEFISNTPPDQRDIETLAASLYMALKRVEYIRVHNVLIHSKALKVINMLAR